MTLGQIEFVDIGLALAAAGDAQQAIGLQRLEMLADVGLVQAHIFGQPPLAREFASIWQAAEKIVFSAALGSVASARTRIERNFDPVMVRQLKSVTEHDITVGGADLAGQAIRAGLVDELQLFLVPVIVGGGKRALPDGARADLELLDTRRFAGGAVSLRYRPTYRSSGPPAGPPAGE